MANTKISALSTASALGGTEEIPANQSGTTKKITLQDVLEFIAANMVLVTGKNVAAPTFASGSVTSNVATVVTSAPHGLKTNQIVTHSGSSGVNVDGTRVITVVNSTTYTFNFTVGNGTISALTIDPLPVVLMNAVPADDELKDPQFGTFYPTYAKALTGMGGLSVVGTPDGVNLALFNVWTRDSFGNPVGWTFVPRNGPSEIRCFQGNSGGGFGFVDFNSSGLLYMGGTGYSQGAWNIPGTGAASDKYLNMIPGTDNTYDIGITAQKVRKVHTYATIFGQSSAKPTLGSNEAAIYAKDVSGTTEVFVQDEAGNETQISPHRMDGPAWLYDLDDPLPLVSWEAQHYLGVVRYVNRSRLDRLLMNGIKPTTEPGLSTTCIHVESFDEFNARLGFDLIQSDWHNDQELKQAKYDAQRAEELAAKAQYDALNPKQKEEMPAPKTPREAKDVRKPMPIWMQARFAALSDPREVEAVSVLGKLRSWLGV